MDDEVFTVREEAQANLEKIGKEFGPAWAKGSLLPSVVEKTKDPSYIKRLTALSAFRRFAPICSEETVEGTILPPLRQLMTDPIPNVRFNSAKVMRALMACVLSAETKATMRKDIEKQREDEDPDVKYFANQALEGL